MRLGIQKTIFLIGLRIHKTIFQACEFEAQPAWRVADRLVGREWQEHLFQFVLPLLLGHDVGAEGRIVERRRCVSNLAEELQVGRHYDPGTEVNRRRKNCLGGQVVGHEASRNLAHV